MAGTASLDLQAFDALAAGGSAWPKLTGDWTVATPLLGPFGDGAHKTVVNLTRLGRRVRLRHAAPVLLAVDRRRASITTRRTRATTRATPLRTGRPTDGKLAGTLLTITAPGEDLLCGTADHYGCSARIGWTRSPVKPAAAGARQAIPVPAGRETRLGSRRRRAGQRRVAAGSLSR